jgi:acetyltransferase-like isoleucine patch superfamily enzyme
MFSSLRTWLSGLAQLRHPDVVRHLGEVRQRREQLRALRAENPGARLSEGIILVGAAPGRLQAATGAQVREGSIAAFGDEEQGYGRIVIGADSWIGQYNNLRACAGGDIVIGARCLVSQFCTLVASQHAHAAGMPIAGQGAQAGPRGVILGDDVWIGAGAVLLPGVEIGAGAIVGANAVVTRNVPPNEIWAGVPAAKIGERR